jgi:hypothetical protein
MTLKQVDERLAAYGLCGWQSRTGRKCAYTETHADAENGPSPHDIPQQVASGRTWAQVVRKVERRTVQYHESLYRESIIHGGAR